MPPGHEVWTFHVVVCPEAVAMLGAASAEAPTRAVPVMKVRREVVFWGAVFLDVVFWLGVFLIMVYSPWSCVCFGDLRYFLVTLFCAVVGFFGGFWVLGGFCFLGLAKPEVTARELL